MELYESIFRRQSVRAYAPAPLTAAQLDEIRAAIPGFATLYADVPLDFRITSSIKGPLKAPAPHYLVINGRGAPGEPENAGFVFEQLALWLDAHGIGCCWLGMTKDTQAQKGDIITIAFGAPQGELHRQPGGFVRKPLAEITDAPDDPRMEAVRLAPSGMNLQPWYFQREGSALLLHKKPPAAPVRLLYKHTDIDMGIALCHFALACGQLGKPFGFTRGGGAAPRGFERFGELVP